VPIWTVPGQRASTPAAPDRHCGAAAEPPDRRSPGLNGAGCHGRSPRISRHLARRTRVWLTWQGSGGFSLDASVRIQGADSAARERLLRYCARPPFALERLRIEHHADEHASTRPRGEAAIR
jgi:hypothetical protein